MSAPVSIVTPLRRVGFAEGVSCVILFGIAMPLKYVAGMPLAVRVAGTVHGVLFILFLVLLAVAMVRRQWAFGRGLLAVIAAAVPFGTFVIDRRLRAWDSDPNGLIAAHSHVGDALSDIAHWIPQADQIALSVSTWSIGQHLDHAMRAQAGIAATLDGSATIVDGPPTTLLGRVLLAVGWIPRGRGRAPPYTVPQPVDAQALQSAFDAAITRHAALAAHLPDIAGDPSRSMHPVFGGLTRRQWLRFAFIHLRHHLKIVRDIAQQA